MPQQPKTGGAASLESRVLRK